MHRIARTILFVSLIASLLPILLQSHIAHAEDTTRYVALNGNDANPGTLSQPWRTITKSVRALRAGQTLYVRAGTYVERVKDFTLPKGTATARITVRAYPGERPVVQGLLWLTGADYWTFDGLNVTWNPTTGRGNEHMLKFTGGTGWVYTRAEIWGARSFAAILITGAPASYTLSYLNIHDTIATNGQWQDHLIYINSYAGGTGGIIEHNLLWNSSNGRAIKVGPSSSSSTTRVGNVTIRYNTLYNNLGPTNINLSYTASNVRIERNIMQRVSDRKANIDATSLSGTNNVAANNIGWESKEVVATGAAGLTNGGGNQWIDPQLTGAPGNFSPRNPAVQGYGRYAS